MRYAYSASEKVTWVFILCKNSPVVRSQRCKFSAACSLLPGWAFFYSTRRAVWITQCCDEPDSNLNVWSCGAEARSWGMTRTRTSLSVPSNHADQIAKNSAVTYRRCFYIWKVNDVHLIYQSDTHQAVYLIGIITWCCLAQLLAALLFLNTENWWLSLDCSTDSNGSLYTTGMTNNCVTFRT